MKNILTILFIAISFNCVAQTAEEFFKSGIEKHNSQDYVGAIAAYSKAIAADKTMRDGYYNRGICELALKDFKTAQKDLDKTIELDPNFAKAYYSRATVLVSLNQVAEALPDLDKTIALDEKIPNALTLRGQIRAQTGNGIGACADFAKAKANGDIKAEQYIKQFCGNEQLKGESLVLDWPDSENWKIGDDQENSETRVIDMIHSNETIDNWTELGNMTSIKGIKGQSVENMMNMLYQQALKNAATSKLTFLEKDEKASNPWILFTLETPSFDNGQTPESQLWYVVQGKQALYTSFIAVKKSTISADQKAKWSKFFKTAQIVYN